MKTVEVYDGTLFECQMLKNILENEGIESFIKDEMTGTRSPVWRPGGGVKLMIAEREYERARSLVREYEKNRQNG